MTFADHFSSQSAAYAAHRPSYPDALGAWLASTAPARDQVWDCATGSGQAATMLARHFARVVATDASAAQIGRGEPSPGVTYQVAAADASGLPERSCDLVAVAQAAHWFDLPAFYDEARRVLKPGGLLAVWCYVLVQTGRPGIDAAVRNFQYGRLGPYWPAGRELVDDQYRSLPFPFEPVAVPEFAMVARWRRADLLGFISTWSAVARCRNAEGRDPIPEIAGPLAVLWPDEDEELDVRWPLYIRAGRA